MTVVVRGADVRERRTKQSVPVNKARGAAAGSGAGAARAAASAKKTLQCSQCVRRRALGAARSPCEVARACGSKHGADPPRSLPARCCAASNLQLL